MAEAVAAAGEETERRLLLLLLHALEVAGRALDRLEQELADVGVQPWEPMDNTLLWSAPFTTRKVFLLAGTAAKISRAWSMPMYGSSSPWAMKTGMFSLAAASTGRMSAGQNPARTFVPHPTHKAAKGQQKCICSGTISSADLNTGRSSELKVATLATPLQIEGAVAAVCRAIAPPWETPKRQAGAASKENRAAASASTFPIKGASATPKVPNLAG